ncbi:MAG TPA: uroporphyrinogen decarboxylase family protein [Phycisphaerae bacterium]|nr:uroporphyrinogen decarboxylase family protein [Phycisphaerae bacterium]
MIGRERIEAVFSGDGVRDLPVVICYESVFLRDHWSRFTRHPWWYLHMPDAERQVAWTRDLAKAVGQDWLQMFPWTSLEDQEHVTVDVRPDGVFRIDRRTGERKHLNPPCTSGWTAGHAATVLHEHQPESPEQIDALITPATGNNGDPQAIEERRKVAAALIEEFGHDLWPYRHVSGPLWKTYDLWGFEGMMTHVATRPDLVQHACERYLEVALRNVREAAEHGAAGIWIEDCLTDMISPEAFASLNVPFLRRLIDEIRSAGMKSIYYFGGNPAGKWDLIRSLGMDALALEEGKKNFRNEIEEIVEQAQGRFVVVGNLDAVGVLENGSEEELRAAIRHQIAAGRRNGSRFIVSLGSPVTPETPVERVRLYCDMAHELGRG